MWTWTTHEELEELLEILELSDEEFWIREFQRGPHYADRMKYAEQAKRMYPQGAHVLVKSEHFEEHGYVEHDDDFGRLKICHRVYSYDEVVQGLDGSLGSDGAYRMKAVLVLL